MKKLICTLALVLASTMAFGQAAKSTTVKEDNSLNKRLDSLLVNIDSLVQENGLLLERIQEKTAEAPRYKIYKTENIYNLLELDTKTGIIKQVQWSLDSEKEFIVTINSTDFSLSNYGPGSFELYATNNMYQFILIDTHLGRVWHVQWGTGGSSSRWIRRIY
ncbi:MAG: hypothetical protein MJZ96_08715 [Paludibacteraceae bacterium]|nr:hypothetical protein [Paludibacteraceae bacterium]